MCQEVCQSVDKMILALHSLFFLLSFSFPSPFPLPPSFSLFTYPSSFPYFFLLCSFQLFKLLSILPMQEFKFSVTSPSLHCMAGPVSLCVFQWRCLAKQALSLVESQKTLQFLLPFTLGDQQFSQCEHLKQTVQRGSKQATKSSIDKVGRFSNL